ncbi:MAG: prolyl oligopeptidase family serine peptidase [Tepidisphaeraceae bacterium]
MLNAQALPDAPRVEIGTDSDVYFGTTVADPYRALEDESRPQTQAFIAAQNERTHGYLNGAHRDAIKTRLTELFDYPRLSAPSKRGKYAIFSTNSGLQNQGVLRVGENVPAELNDKARVLIDPNALSADGTVSLGSASFTKDGSLMAYGLAKSGSDHIEIRIKTVATGVDLPDVLPSSRQGGVAWKIDNSGFYYSKFPKTTEHGKAEQALGQQVFYHQLGTDAAADKLVYERPDDKELGLHLGITDDGKYEVMFLNHGTKTENRVYWRHANSNSEWTKLIDEETADFDLVDNDGSVFYFKTTDAAERYRLIAIDVDKPARENWREVLPMTADVLSDVQLVDEKWVVTLRRDAYDLLKIYNKAGTFLRDVALPTIGSVGVSAANREDGEIYYTFTSFSYPSTVFRYDLKAGQSTSVFAPSVKFEPNDYETRQVFAKSKDGTQVPVFITFKKGLKLDSANPCLLYGYGGFNISMSPSFSSARVAWLERGGVYATACLRGGGEYGVAWHQAGMFEKKQNVFDDLAAAAETLIAEKFTSSPKLAIQGGSNGGLLVGACMLQRPELYGAVVCQVGVLDMLRYQKLGIGRFWTVEFGNAESSAEQFKYLYAYSPLHNVKPGVAYPPLLVTTGAGDNRVVPGHSYKFAAAMQAISTGPNPVLLRIEDKAGHGGGKPTGKIIDEQADVYEFLFRTIAIGK